MNKVIYISKSGNTKKLASAIAKGAGISAVSAEHFDLSAPIDTLYVGASVYAGAIDGKLRKLLTDLKPSKVKKVIVFGTSAGKKTALPEIKSILEPNGVVVSSDEFHCKGSFLLANHGRPNGEDLKQAEVFAKKTCGGQK